MAKTILHPGRHHTTSSLTLSLTSALQSSIFWVPSTTILREQAPQGTRKKNTTPGFSGTKLVSWPALWFSASEACKHGGGFFFGPVAQHGAATPGERRSQINPQISSSKSRVSKLPGWLQLLARSDPFRRLSWTCCHLRPC